MGKFNLPNIKIPKFNFPFKKGGKGAPVKKSKGKAKFSLADIQNIISNLKKGGKKLPVGLDIGSHSIKVCHLHEEDNAYSLLSIGSAILPAGAVEEGTLQDAEAVSKVITALMKNLKIKEKRVAVTVSGYSVIVKKINLSVMAEKELDEYIHAEAGQYIPFDIEDVYLDYQDLKTNTEGHERTDVMLVAARKDVVDAYLAMLRSVGLLAVLVDVDGFALENSHEFCAAAKDESVVLVDIGASKMSINIIAEGLSVLARDVVLGSRQLTEQIQSQFGIDAEEAEALKIGRQPAEDKQGELEDIFVNSCTQWALETKKAIDLFYTNNPEGTLKKMILSGGGSRIKGLPEFFHEETGLSIEIFDPFVTISFDHEKINPDYVRYMAPEMAICTGLAIRESVL